MYRGLANPTMNKKIVSGIGIYYCTSTSTSTALFFSPPGEGLLYTRTRSPFSFYICVAGWELGYISILIPKSPCLLPGRYLATYLARYLLVLESSGAQRHSYSLNVLSPLMYW